MACTTYCVPSARKRGRRFCQRNACTNESPTCRTHAPGACSSAEPLRGDATGRLCRLIELFVGNLSGLRQTNLRRLLSFSSIAQTGYMLAALATFSVAGLVAVVFSIWNHGLLKSNFFMLIGKEGSKYEDAELQKLAGMGRSDRPLGFLFGSSALAMMGAPPFGMFWSEILIVLALVSASSALFFWVAIAVVGNIVLSIGYYYKIINAVVFGKPEGTRQARPWADLVPPMTLLALSLLTGLLPFIFLNHLV